MAKPNKRLTSWSRTYLVLELAHEGTTGRQLVTLCASLPGREDVTERSWVLANGLPTEAQVRDMAHYVAKLATEGTIAFCGAQAQIPGIQ